MALPITSLLSLEPGRIDWSVSVRIVRLWTVESTLIAGRINSIELILLDRDGDKIQATVPVHCVERFRHVLEENRALVLTYFRVSNSVGSSLATYNRTNITFLRVTKVTLAENYVIHRFGFTLLSSRYVRMHAYKYNYLVDVMGLLTALHYECVLDESGYMATVVKFELTDHRGKLECALKGKYVGMFKELLDASHDGLPVVVIQFGKLFRDRGCIVVGSVEHITRVLIDPPVAETVHFKNRLILAGSLRYNDSVRSPRVLIPEQNEFNRIVPNKTVSELLATAEHGLFVVCAKIVGCFHADKWWFPICDCGRLMKALGGQYRCVHCYRTTFKVTAQLRLVVEDETGVTSFEMFEYLLQGIPALNYNQEGLKFALSQAGLQIIKQNTIIFIVKKGPHPIKLDQDAIEVVRLSDDDEIIELCHTYGKNYTPVKCMFKPSFPDVMPSPKLRIDCGPSDAHGAANGKEANVAFVKGPPEVGFVAPSVPADVGLAGLSALSSVPAEPSAPAEPSVETEPVGDGHGDGLPPLPSL